MLIYKNKTFHKHCQVIPRSSEFDEKYVNMLSLFALFTELISQIQMFMNNVSLLSKCLLCGLPEFIILVYLWPYVFNLNWRYVIDYRLITRVKWSS